MDFLLHGAMLRTQYNVANKINLFLFPILERIQPLADVFLIYFLRLVRTYKPD
jgi:hypothetical protein